MGSTPDTIVDLAIDLAITQGADQATEHCQAPPITPLERYAVAVLADYAVDAYRDAVQQEEIGVFVAAQYAEDQLLRKVLAAFVLEHTVCGRGLPDGMLGRAAGRVIDQLTPYARAGQPRWWHEVMEEGR